MALPAAVKAMAEESEAALVALEESQIEAAEGATSLEDLVPDQADQTDDEPDAEASNEEDATEVDEQSEEGELDPQLEAAEKKAALFEQKYKTLEGKYNAEVPRMTRDLDFLRGRVEAMVQGSQAPAAEEPGSGNAEPGFKRYLKKEELDEYDADILDFQSRVARGEAEAVNAELRKELQEIKALVTQSSQTSAVDSLWGKIEAHFPGAQQINKSDPLWGEFLNGVEPMSGKTFREIGAAAFSMGDVARMVDLFTSYAGEPGGGATEEALPAEIGEGEDTGRPPVKPSRSKGGRSVRKSKAAPVIKQSDIPKFFTEVTQGKYRGREKEMKAREAAIERAVMENRVVPG